MWFLLMIFLSPELHSTMILAHYTTEEECQVMRDSVGFNMAEAYPQENDFRIVCQYRPRVI